MGWWFRWSREEIRSSKMGGSTVLPLGFVETEGSAAAPGPGRGKKRLPSPPTSPRGDDEDSPKSATGIDEGEWLVSDSGSEEGEDHGIQEENRPFTVDNFPRASCNRDEQANVMYDNPETKLRGPWPIRLYPSFKCGNRVFASDYNLGDKSEIIVSSAEDCLNECCCCPMCLLQFIDIQIAGYQHAQSGRANIFGFVAARDTIEPLRNYVYRHEINNCEAVSVKRETGMARLSLTSPARVVSICTRALIEFEIHVRTENLPGDEPKGDCLIEGCTEFTNMRGSVSFIEHRRLYGERCALDIKYMVLMNAVEARVEVKVLHLGTITGSVNMKLYAKTSGFNDVIRLFQGAAPEPGSMISFAVAVERRNNLDLCIKAAPRDDPFLLGQEEKPPMQGSWWQCSFGSGYHRIDEKVAELGDFGAVSVKVTWKSYKKKT